MYGCKLAIMESCGQAVAKGDAKLGVKVSNRAVF